MNSEAKEILEKYREGNCSEEELALLESWYLSEEIVPIDFTIEELDNVKRTVWAKLHIQGNKKNFKLWHSYEKIAAAAVILICLSFSIYFYVNRYNKPSQSNIASTEILPGSKKAILTLANGKSIALNEANNGKLVDQAGAGIYKTADGQLNYNTNIADQQAEVQMNLLTIPKGGYYIIKLVDGTKVWLNAASSLKYPTTFNGKERIVELTGEGYFEVAHQNNQPFKVISKNQIVQVLGTHFNINAHHDEPNVTTSLAEGSVKINTQNGSSKILAPQQQANVIGDLITVRAIDVNNEIAWTQNNFVFQNENIGSIMRKIARWYDVEVVCPDGVSDMVFNGSISRGKNIKQVLKIMQLTESVHFKFEGRRITVMP